MDYSSIFKPRGGNVHNWVLQNSSKELLYPTERTVGSYKCYKCGGKRY